MNNRRQLAESSILYIDGVGNVLKMKVLLAGESELEEVKTLLASNLFTLDDDAYIQDNVLSTGLYDLENTSRTLLHIEKSSDQSTSNCILCAVDQYLKKAGYATFIEEYDPEALKAHTLFDQEAVPITLIVETNTDWYARLYYANIMHSELPLSLYVHADDIQDGDVLKFVAEWYNSSVVGDNTVFLHA